jgi:hypothetical protein
MFSRQQPQSPRRIDTDGLVPPLEQRTAPPPRAAVYDDGIIGSPGMVPAAASPPVESHPVATVPPGTVVLSRAYQAHGEPVQRLTFRAPTTGDLQKVNAAPFKFTLGEHDGRVIIDDVETNWNAVAQYIVLLASPPLPSSTVGQLTLDDLDTCAEALVPFFMMKSAFRMPSMQRIGSPSTTT